MNLFYKRTESQEEVSLTINRYIPLYVVLSSVVLPMLITNELVGSVLISIIEANEISSLILGIVWGVQMFKLRHDFTNMIKTKNYTISGRSLSLKNPATYHIHKDV